MTLEEASLAKLEMVCDKLELGPRDHVLEIGTGWGGFAVYAAHDARLPGHDDHDLAGAVRRRRRSASQRPASSTSSTCCSTTTATSRGSYDKLVSIEMIEAVGWKDFGTFFERCSDLLAPNGAMLLQAITMDDRAYEVEKASKSFIRTYVFPERLPALARR